jgi:hypothetical protein
MKPLLTLKKHNSKIEVSQENGLICFCYGRGYKEWVIREDLDSFIRFHERNGYKRTNGVPPVRVQYRQYTADT